MKQILTALLIALVLISGCSDSTIIAQPLSEMNASTVLEVEANVTAADADPCAEVTCGVNSKCSEGRCACEDGYTNCGGICISNDACCKDSECGPGKICENSACVSTNCGYNEAYDSVKRKCGCNTESKYCTAQKRCIPKDSCCANAECDSGEGCVLTKFLISVCMKDDRKLCRTIVEKKKEVFAVGDFKYYVEFRSVLQNSKIDLIVNEKEFVLLKDELQPLDGNVTMYVESFETIGGYCKEE